VCVVSDGTSCVCCILWYKVCACKVSGVYSVLWYKLCVCVCVCTHACAVSGGTLFVCKVYGDTMCVCVWCNIQWNICV